MGLKMLYKKEMKSNGDFVYESNHSMQVFKSATKHGKPRQLRPTLPQQIDDTGINDRIEKLRQTPKRFEVSDVVSYERIIRAVVYI